MLQQKVSRRTWKAFGSSREGLKGRRGVVIPARKRTSSRVRAGKGDIEEDFLCSSTTSSRTSTDRSLGRVSICTSSCFSEDSSERRREGNRNRVAAVLGAVELARWGVGLDTAKAVALESSGSIAGGGLHIAHLMDQFVILVESSAAHSGPFGLLILGSVIATSELVPLVPTQPLALVSGLLFGASKGALVTLVGTTTAASVAFTISSGPLGEKMRNLVGELEGRGESKEGEGQNHDSDNLLTKLAGEVEDLNPLKQMMSVVLLRLSPVVPFSISNYMLGLTPIRFIPFSVGTFLGMSPWCLLYATLGKTAGTILLKNSTDGLLTIDGLEDLGKLVQQQLSNYSELLELLAVATPFMLGLLIFQTIRRNQQNVANLDEDSSSK